ncbi:MAG: DUF1365 domain-containing protein [Pseudomonadota bacterium]
MRDVVEDQGTEERGGCLYQGHVMHKRLRPFVHQFRYRVFTLLLDLDRLEETCSRLRLLSLDRFGLLAFHRRDHGARDGSDLRAWAEGQLARAGRPRPARIMLLSFPRILGYVFNPLSVYFCEDADGRLESVIYEVKNTFGDQHPYVLGAEADAKGVVRHSHDKGFFVSPFIAMTQTYKFTIRQPAQRLSIGIRQHDDEGEWLIATQTGQRVALSDRSMLRLWAMHPLMTLKVMVAIHWQALKLWLKGARFHRYRGPYPEESNRPASAEPSRAH